jgi:cysteine synthase
MPDDAAEEKAVTIAALGASVQRVRPVSITHPDHFVNVARRAAASAVASGGPGAACFADQFENEANFRAHYEGTGAEVWEQTHGALHAFVAAAGTGGTLAGVGAALRARNPGVRLYLVDPPGSSLFNRVTRGVMYAATEAEGKRTRHQVDTITEGIGINRLTANFMRAPRLDGAFRGSDQEAIAMARHLRAADGLFVGSSAAMNAVGALRVAQELGACHSAWGISRWCLHMLGAACTQTRSLTQPHALNARRAWAHCGDAALRRRRAALVQVLERQLLGRGRAAAATRAGRPRAAAAAFGRAAPGRGVRVDAGILA